MLTMANTRRLFIGGLFPEVKDSDLKERFGKFGKVDAVEIKIKKDNEGNPVNTFAHMNISIDDKGLNKCLNTYNKTKWKGGVLKIQPAKENFLDKLKAERKEASMVQSAPVDVIEEPNRTVVKGAPPGTEIKDKKNWVVGKYGREMPVLFLRRKDKKKIMKYDPSKYCHALKSLDTKVTEKDKKITDLTWDLGQDEDSEIIKKRKGIFPKFKKKRKQVSESDEDNSNEESVRKLLKRHYETKLANIGNNTASNARHTGDKSLANGEADTFEVVGISQKSVGITQNSMLRIYDSDDRDSADTDEILEKSKPKQKDKGTNQNKPVRKSSQESKTNLKSKTLDKSIVNSQSKNKAQRADLVQSSKTNSDNVLPHREFYTKCDILDSSESESDRNTFKRKGVGNNLNGDMKYSDMDSSSETDVFDLIAKGKVEKLYNTHDGVAKQDDSQNMDFEVVEVDEESGARVDSEGYDTDDIISQCKNESNVTRDRKKNSAKDRKQKLVSKSVDKLKHSSKSENVKSQSKNSIHTTNINKANVMTKTLDDKASTVGNEDPANLQDAYAKALNEIKQLKNKLAIQASNSEPSTPVNYTAIIGKNGAEKLLRNKVESGSGGYDSDIDEVGSVNESICSSNGKKKNRDKNPQASQTKGKSKSVENSKAEMDKPNSESDGYEGDTSENEQHDDSDSTVESGSVEEMVSSDESDDENNHSSENIIGDDECDTESSSESDENSLNEDSEDEDSSSDDDNESVSSLESSSQNELCESARTKIDVLKDKIQSGANKSKTSKVHENISCSNTKELGGYGPDVNNGDSDNGSVGDSDSDCDVFDMIEKKKWDKLYEDPNTKPTSAQTYKKTESGGAKGTNSVKTQPKVYHSSSDSDDNSDEQDKKTTQTTESKPVSAPTTQETTSGKKEKQEKKKDKTKNKEKKMTDNEKRLETLKQKENEQKSHQKLIQKALKSVDASGGNNKKIVFDSDTEDERATALVAGKGKAETSANDNANTKLSLFDNSSEDEDVGSFEVKPQFEGKAGAKLYTQQSRFADDRFKMDAKFVESDSEMEEEVEEGDDGVSSQTEKDKSEKDRALDILKAVVGENIKKTLKTKFTEVTHYDPTKEDHKELEIRTEPPAKKKKTKHKDISKEEESEKEEEILPEVSTDKFFEVAGELNFKEAVEENKDKPFSFLSMFGGGDENADKEAGDKVFQYEKPTPDHTKSLWQPDPDDSSEGEGEEHGVIKPVSMDANITNKFFITPDHPDVQCSVESFRRTEDIDTIREKWLETRFDLIEACKVKRKKALRRRKDDSYRQALESAPKRKRQKKN